MEIGGTVGDIEGLPFLEAVRQFKKDVGKDNVIYVHLTLVPFIQAAGELKTKATQHSVKELRAIGIQPDVLLCRTDKEHLLTPGIKSKIALFCDVEEEAVIAARDVDTIYEVPLAFHEQGLDESICKLLGLPQRPADLSRWEEIVRRVKAPRSRVRIGIVGKYIEVKDSYKSLSEALAHGGIAHEVAVDVVWLDAERLEREGLTGHVEGLDGILVPGGFGDRGIEGKIQAIRYARERNVPYFGICLGMQCAVIEYARHVCGLEGANSTEFDPRPAHNVIDLLPEQRNITDKGGTMRLGLYPVVLAEGSDASRAYGQGAIQERHRHRYEVNNDYLPDAREERAQDLGHLGRKAAGRDHRAGRAIRGSWRGNSTRSSGPSPGRRTRSSRPSSAPPWITRPGMTGTATGERARSAHRRAHHRRRRAAGADRRSVRHRGRAPRPHDGRAAPADHRAMPGCPSSTSPPTTRPTARPCTPTAARGSRRG